MIFASNPQFIFHDSRGFEAGSEDELRIVKRFIEDRAKRHHMQDQLHAIWCVQFYELANSLSSPDPGIASLPTTRDRY